MSTKKIHIYKANNVSKALEILKTAVIDVVVTDLNMPGVSGFALLAWMDETYPHIPVIVMSACARDSVEGQLKGLRFADYVEKPLDLQNITKSILKAALQAKHIRQTWKPWSPRTTANGKDTND